jgi:hypothetical protein
VSRTFGVVGAIAGVCVWVGAPMGGCAGKGSPRAGAGAADVRTAEVFPHVRVNTSERWVEFDARVTPMMVFTPRTPLLFLEAVACSPDTRPHETLVVTDARPSHVHAGLLMIGLEPGRPGGVRFEGRTPVAVHPEGAGVDVTFIYVNAAGERRTARPTDWIVNARGGGAFLDAEVEASARLGLAERGSPGFVFAGSFMSSRGGREVYKADEEGTVIGLMTFGHEPVAWSRTISPEAAIQAPEWVAKQDAVPPAETPVVVRLTPRAGQ